MPLDPVVYFFLLGALARALGDLPFQYERGRATLCGPRALAARLTTVDRHRKKLLMITAEAALERRLAGDLVRLGAQGYTVLDAGGAGSRGQRAADWEADRSIQFQVLCEAWTADTIALYLKDAYFKDYAMTIFIADVEGLRSRKF